MPILVEMGYCLIALWAGALLAQLESSSGVPLAGADAPATGQTELVKLPRSFHVSQRMLAQHGTEIYKLDEWKATCPGARGKRAVALLERVLYEERRERAYVVRTVAGERDFALACRLAPVPGRFTLIFVDPGHKRAAALVAKTPDYIVP